MAVALLANLREFKKSVPYAKSRSNRKRAKVYPFDYHVLSKRSEIDISALSLEVLYLLKTKHADLPVPFPCVDIALDTPIRNHLYTWHFSLLSSLLFTYAYSNYLALIAHYLILRSPTWICYLFDQAH